MKQRIESFDDFVSESHEGEKPWQDIAFGDTVHIKSMNKTGTVIKTYGRKFQVEFVDGTDKTFDASEIEAVTNEKASSVAQQRLFGQAFAIRKGKAKREGALAAVLAIVDGKMTDKEIEDFASTSHEGLPKHVKEGEEINESAATIVLQKGLDDVQQLMYGLKKNGLTNSNLFKVAQSLETELKDYLS